jgi:hypothetical protein
MRQMKMQTTVLPILTGSAAAVAGLVATVIFCPGSGMGVIIGATMFVAITVAVAFLS